MVEIHREYSFPDLFGIITFSHNKAPAWKVKSLTEVFRFSEHFLHSCGKTLFYREYFIGDETGGFGKKRLSSIISSVDCTLI
jgi:hypothetical protein